MSLDILNRRLSVPSRQLGEPAPDDAQIEAMLSAAIRVPDHGRLTPYRLIRIRGDARRHLGEALARIHAAKEPDAPAAAIDKDRTRFDAAPLVVAVVARVSAGHKVPVQEQLLSSACVAYNLLLAAQALGFGAQWLTGWAAYDPVVTGRLGLAEHERVLGFLHIGTASAEAPERPRPDPMERLTDWTP